MVQISTLFSVAVTTLALGAEAAPSKNRLDARTFSPSTCGRDDKDFQDYNSGWGGIFAPTVNFVDHNIWKSDGRDYNTCYDALIGSCNVQSSKCLWSWNVWDKTVCYGSQLTACKATARLTADVINRVSTALVSPSQVTTPRTVYGDLQTFTSSLAGVPAPAVVAAYGKYKMDSLYFYNLRDALKWSCLRQSYQCVSAAFQSGSWSTKANCVLVQAPACLVQADKICSGTPAPSPSPSPAPSASSASAAASSSSKAATSAASSVSSAAVSSSSVAAVSSSSAAAVSSSSAAAVSSSSEAAVSSSSAAAVSSSAAASPVSSAAPQPSAVTLPEGWNPISAPGVCVRDKQVPHVRALVGASTASDDMTIGKCISFCSSQGMQYSGLEYGRECYCGNEFNRATADNTAPCDTPCAGDASTICGGSDLLSVYQNPNLVYTNTVIGAYAKQGCVSEVSSRALTATSLVASSMTVEKCLDFCGAGNYAFAGLEYGSECYCGNALENGASLETYSNQCNMPCSGDAGEICGGPNAISLWSTQRGLPLVAA